MSIVPARPALLALFALAACSPALNWREVRVHSLLALLPCKPAPAVWSAQGQAQDGTALQAQFTWIARGQDLYHLAVYAKQLTPAMTDPFFSESKVP